MARYECQVCGYIYNEELGNPEGGIAPGTAWEDVHPEWRCPVCKAEIALFEPLDVEPEPKPVPDPEPVAAPAPEAAPGVSGAAQAGEKDAPYVRPNHYVATDADFAAMEPHVLSTIFSNLSLGADKQYRHEESAAFHELATYYGARVPASEGASLDAILAQVGEDLDSRIPAAREAAVAAGDRGSQRVLNWAEKVSLMHKNILERYEREGDALLEGKTLYVCEACGFVHIGTAAPELCPVCKVPAWKFQKVG